MNIDINSKTKALLGSQLAAYPRVSIDELLQAALRCVNDREILRAQIEAAEDQIEAGQAIELNSEEEIRDFFQSICDEGRLEIRKKESV